MQPESPKLCVVFHGRKDVLERTDDCYEYNFYIVGQDSSPGAGGEEYPYVEPTIQFKGFTEDSPAVAFCALNSTLYMFEGDDTRRPRCKDELTSDGKFAGKLEITPEILAGSNYKLERKGLDDMKPMRQRKNCPIALPTPDGKRILVFSSQVFSVEDPGYSYTGFETYNAAEDSWEALPPLPRSDYFPHKDHVFLTYGFVSESLFLVQARSGLVFSLDLQTMKWAELFLGLFPWNEGCFFGIGGFCLNPLGAFDATYCCVVLSGFEPPLSEFTDGDYGDDYLYLRDICMLSPCIANAPLGGYEENGDGDIVIGVVQAQRPSGFARQYYRLLEERNSLPRSEYNDRRLSDPVLKYNNLHVIVDIRRIDPRDMVKYKPEPDMPSVNTVDSKTIKLLVDFDFDEYIFGIMNAFFI